MPAARRADDDAPTPIEQKLVVLPQSCTGRFRSRNRVSASRKRRDPRRAVSLGGSGVRLSPVSSGSIVRPDFGAGLEPPRRRDQRIPVLGADGRRSPTERVPAGAKYDTVSRVAVASTPKSRSAQAPAVATTTAPARTPATATGFGGPSRQTRRERAPEFCARVDRRGEQGFERQIGIDDAAVLLEEPRRTGLDPQWKTALDLRAAEHLEADTTGGEATRFGSQSPRSRVPELEQRPAEFGLQLPPQRIRLLRESHPARVGVGQPDDARAAVARPEVVAELELLEDHDVAPHRASARADASPITPAPDHGDLDVRAHCAEGIRLVRGRRAGRGAASV